MEIFKIIIIRKNYEKLSLVALLALGTLGSVSTIQASELEVSGNIGASSNYIWRGMTQTKW